MKQIRTIITIFLIPVSTVSTLAQIDTVKTVKNDFSDNFKKFGVGLMFSTIYLYNESLWGYDVEKTDAFYDLYDEWPYPVPPGMEVLIQPTRIYTHVIGLKYKVFKNYSPQKVPTSIYDFTNLTSYYQLNYSPLRMKHSPYIGMKLIYEYKYFKSAPSFSSNYNQQNKSHLVSLQIPAGLSFNIKTRINISIETTFNLSSYSSVNFETNDMIIYPPSTTPIPVKNSGTLAKVWTPVDLVKKKHLMHALLFKIYYRFDLKTKM